MRGLGIYFLCKKLFPIIAVFWGSSRAIPKFELVFVKTVLKYFITPVRKTTIPYILVHMLLCTEIMSNYTYVTYNLQPHITLCADGSGLQPAKYDCHFCTQTHTFVLVVADPFYLKQSYSKNITTGIFRTVMSVVFGCALQR